MADPDLEKLIRSVREHKQRYLETDGAEGHLWDSTPAGGPGPIPTLLLTTTGRKTGEERVQPLIYGEDGGCFVVIASKGGAPTHPAWYLNLVANPEVKVQVARRKFTARARNAMATERAGLWATLAQIYPPYDDYQARTDRKIPVVVLEPQN